MEHDSNSTPHPAGHPLAPVDRQPPDLKLPPDGPRAGWAVVGLGALSLEEVLPAFAETELSRVAALVSGHRDKAARVAKAYGVPPAALYDYETFDSLRDARDVDIVYIVLPNHMHAEFTIRALEAGKHVLCEKPMATSAAECERMIAAAKAANRKLMIAYRLHYEPFNVTVRDLCASRALGAVKTFSATNGQTTRAPNIRLSAALGGGPIGDTGIYCINAGRYITGEEPSEVTAVARRTPGDPDFREVPETVVFTLHYPSGVVGHCETSFGMTESRHYRVNCADGYIDLDRAFAYRGQRLRVKRGDLGQPGARDEEQLIAPINHFAAQMDHLSGCVLHGGDVRTPGEMGLADQRIMDAIEEAIRTGGTARVGLERT